MVLTDAYRKAPEAHKEFWLSQATRMIAPGLVGDYLFQTLYVLAILAPEAPIAIHEALQPSLRRPTGEPDLDLF